MQYAMLIYLDEQAFNALTKDEQNRVHRACGAWHDDLVKRGRSVGAVGLQATTTATTLCGKNGKLAITDGPFAETKEVLGGFELLDCADLDEAMAIAKAFPAVQSGHVAVELRPMVPGGKCEA